MPRMKRVVGAAGLAAGVLDIAAAFLTGTAKPPVVLKAIASGLLGPRAFRGGTEVLIAHDGAIYRMKITRQGKLILNK